MNTTPNPEVRSKFAGLYVQRRPPSRADTLYRAYLASFALARRTRGHGAQAHYHRADRYLEAFERARATERRANVTLAACLVVAGVGLRGYAQAWPLGDSGGLPTTHA